MATFSEIEIKIEEDMVLDSTIRFTIETTSFVQEVIFTYKTNRVTQYQVEILPPTGTPGESSAISFVNAFNLDLNNSLAYEVTRVADTVTIKSKINGVNFTFPFAFKPPFSTVADVVFTITNAPATVFELTDFVISEADTNPCDNFKVTATTSTTAISVVNPPLGANTDNPIIYEIPRGYTGTSFKAISSFDTIEHFFNIPTPLSLSNFSVNYVNNPTDVTVTVIMANTFNITLEYSIDNVTFQSSNVFILAEGVYDIYVRDNLGCQITTNIVVSFTSVNSAFFDISKANGIRYAQVVTHGDCGNYKTDENTLSCQTDVKKPFKEIQQYQSCDIEPTQFRSNYATKYAEIIELDNNNNVVPLSIGQVTNNLGREDRRDAKIYAITPTKTGIYFTFGNLYDYTTGIDTGEDYVLNGSLPEWGQLGFRINVGAVWYIIEDIFYDESINARVLVFTSTYGGTDHVTTNVFSKYNVDNYEVYQYSIDFSAYIGQRLKVRLLNQDPTFTDLEHISEEIQVEIRHKNTLEIIYYSDRNSNNIIYSNGFRSKIRLEYFRREGRHESETEINKTDTTVHLTEAKLYELEHIEFEPVTKEMMRKLLIALVSRRLFIDGVGYRINDDIEVDPAIEDTNLYSVSVELIKTAEPLSTTNTGGFFISSISNIPTLLEQDNSYISY